LPIVKAKPPLGLQERAMSGGKLLGRLRRDRQAVTFTAPTRWRVFSRAIAIAGRAGPAVAGGFASSAATPPVADDHDPVGGR